MDERRSRMTENYADAFLPRDGETGEALTERARLVRYCVRVTGDREAAEDIAQETLVIAWRNQASLRDPAAYSSWVVGIARNLCLRYLRQMTTERRYLTPHDGGETPISRRLESVPDSSLPDPESYLERAEIVDLLDRALGSLPRDTHDLLIARYVENLSLAEIAARRGQREETTAVHLHRGRQALRRVLSGPKLRDQSLALGVVQDASELRQLLETRIWCPKCGKRRLRGYLNRGIMCHKSDRCTQPLHKEAKVSTEFLLRCPECDQNENSLIFMGLIHCQPGGDLLDGIKGIKPALNRVSLWWENFAREATTRRAISCIRCGQRTVVSVCAAEDWSHGVRYGEPAVFSRCCSCGHACSLGVMDIALHIEAGRDFWRDNPRLVACPARNEMTADGPVIVTRLQSVTGNARLDVVCRADTLAVIRMERT